MCGTRGVIHAEAISDIRVPGDESLDVPASFPGNFGGYMSRASLGQGETPDDSRRTWVDRRVLLFEYLLIFT